MCHKQKYNCGNDAEKRDEGNIKSEHDGSIYALQAQAVAEI